MGVPCLGIYPPNTYMYTHQHWLDLAIRGITIIHDELLVHLNCNLNKMNIDYNFLINTTFHVHVITNYLFITHHTIYHMSSSMTQWCSFEFMQHPLVWCIYLVLTRMFQLPLCELLSSPSTSHQCVIHITLVESFITNIIIVVLDSWSRLGDDKGMGLKDGTIYQLLRVLWCMCFKS